MVKVGDAVWYYFLHAFCESEQTHPACKVYPITGKFEMRCRIARVTAVHPTPVGFDALMIDPGPVEGRVHLAVEFHDDDRVQIPGGVGCRPDREQKFVLAHISQRIGHINQAWPDHGRWAFEQKTVDKE